MCYLWVLFNREPFETPLTNNVFVKFMRCVCVRVCVCVAGGRGSSVDSPV